jgi:hypothetical protein
MAVVGEVGGVATANEDICVAATDGIEGAAAPHGKEVRRGSTGRRCGGTPREGGAAALHTG